MIQRQLKLRLTRAQKAILAVWVNNLTGVWNFAVRKIGLDATDGIYYSQNDFQNMLAGHSSKLGIPSQVIQGVLRGAFFAWRRCLKKTSKRPRLKGSSNKLNYIPFPSQFGAPRQNKVRIPGIGLTRFHAQELPDGAIKCGRIVRRASGWYLCLFIDAQPNTIPITGNGQVGVDPGFISLLTLSTGEKIEHPKELQRRQDRLAQAQRGHDLRLAARIQEKIANQRKDRNHKLSRRLVAENELICFSKDNLKGLSKRFGKSVASSATGQLRQMFVYKCRAGGRRYVEVASKNSTRTCSTCGALSGPTGWAGLKVRIWGCASCGTTHDRDVNAAINTLLSGAGAALESGSNGIPHLETKGIQFPRVLTYDGLE